MTEKNVKLTDKVYWIGYIDDRKVPFHRLILENGTTYNSYLLKTKKPTVIDTVDLQFGKLYMDNLHTHIDPSEIKYIVINHVEPDHAGGLPVLINKAKNAQIVTNELAAKILKPMFKLHNKEFLIVKDGDTLDIGGKTLKFYETPYLHTAETMVTYCIEDKILFSCDQFSSHIAAHELFNDLTDVAALNAEFESYYQTLMHPHRSYVQNMLKKIKELDIKIIAPSHGYILRKDVAKYIEMYDQLSQPKAISKKALILYSSMTGNTAKVSDLLTKGLENRNINSNTINIKNATEDEIKEALQEADAVFIGSSTRYGDIVGDLESLLKKLKTMDLSTKLAIAFGSYGWSGEAIEVIQDYLKETNMQVINTSQIIQTTGMEHLHFPIRVKFVPEDSEAERVIESAELIGDFLLAQG